MVVDLSPGGKANETPTSPMATGGADVGCVLDDDAGTSPPSGRRGSGGSVRPPKKTAGRKPAAMATTGSVTAAAQGELGAALVPVSAGAKAKRSKATPVAQRAPSVRAKAKLATCLPWRVPSSAPLTRTWRSQVTLCPLTEFLTLSLMIILRGF